MPGSEDVDRVYLYSLPMVSLAQGRLPESMRTMEPFHELGRPDLEHRVDIHSEFASGHRCRWQWLKVETDSRSLSRSGMPACGKTTTRPRSMRGARQRLLLLAQCAEQTVQETRGCQQLDRSLQCPFYSWSL